MNTIASRDEFKPIRIRKKIVVNCNDKKDISHIEYDYAFHVIKRNNAI